MYTSGVDAGKKKAMHQSVGEVPETDGRADFAVNPKSKPAVESV